MTRVFAPGVLMRSNAVLNAPDEVSATLAMDINPDSVSGSEGAAVSSITDPESGNAFTAAAGEEPTLRLSFVNGHKALQFDGTNDHLHCSTVFLTGSAGAVYLVVRFDNVATDMTVLGSADIAAATRRIQFGLLGATTDNIFVQQRNADTGDTIRGDQNLVADTWYIVEVISNDTAYAMSVNGTSQALTVVGGANTGDWFTETTARDNITIGSLHDSGGDANFLKGYVARLLAYSQFPDTASRAAIRRYLGSQYAIAVS